ncbi:MAG: hypothetical protein KatS3mg096_772 [Candidatus Parcubacteria bacterium]|nr:MAG: hypothetical protein KatS3mg096_772 [Candidatus Parcubacteria bacterium]
MDKIKEISEKIKEAEYKIKHEKSENIKQGYFNQFVDLTMEKNKKVSEKIKEDRKKTNFDKHYESLKDFLKQIKR